MDNALTAGLFVTASSVLSKVNPEITKFFSSNMIVFILVALYVGRTKTTAVAIASGFFAALLATIITTVDYTFITEPFELIYPGPNSSPSCMNMKKADLVKAYNSENKLKVAMVEAGVPYNLEMNDVNSPEIATFLANSSNSAFAECKLIV
jgi:membrane-bound metal-dependent hydrolase YbcI (DUF457 family)